MWLWFEAWCSVVCGCGGHVLFGFLLHFLFSVGRTLWIGEVGECSVGFNLGL